MPWSQSGVTQYHTVPDKGFAIKEFVVCNNWDLEPSKPSKWWPKTVINRHLRY